jgi:hypothetical protein
MKEFEKLRNYSCSMPTAFVVGKRWKCAKHYHDQDMDDPSKWFMFEDMIVDSKCVARRYEIHIMSENEELISNRLYGR